MRWRLKVALNETSFQKACFHDNDRVNGLTPDGFYHGCCYRSECEILSCVRPRNSPTTKFLTMVGDIDGDNEGVEVGPFMEFNMKNIDEVLAHKLSSS